MKPGWYIINYHDVNYEDSILTRALGSTIRPDLFRQQLGYLSKRGDFCSIGEGIDRLRSDSLDRAYFSIWFDDGFKGLKTYARDICTEFNIVPAVSICSRFVEREEMFWRCKLSALAHLDGLRLVRAELEKSFAHVPFKVRKWTLEHYCDEVQQAISRSYEEVTTERFRNDAFRIFLDLDEVSELMEDEWDMVNHSAAHIPWSIPIGWDRVKESFCECETFLSRIGGNTAYWVIPFDFGYENYAKESETVDRIIVRVGNKYNSPKTVEETLIWRSAAPEAGTFRNLF